MPSRRRDKFLGEARAYKVVSVTRLSPRPGTISQGKGRQNNRSGPAKTSDPSDAKMADAPVKTEQVKLEDGLSPGPMDEDDLYEDGDGPGDLEFYDPASDQANKMYMVRLPKALWKAWSHLDDDAEIQIGTVRQWMDKDGKPRMKMLLNTDIPQQQTVPREYNLDIQGTNMSNHFVFTEEDLPGFKAKSKSRNDAISAGIPLHLLRPKSEKVEKPKWERGRREQYFRKAIPKKTKVVGKIAYELSCAPLHAEEHNHLLRQQIAEADRTRGLKILDRRSGAVLTVGSGRGADWDNNFIKSQPKPTKQKKAELKTTRIPENELLDKLFRCFARYQYWSLKSLRAELKQPETYLRQTLEKIAMLQKNGPFANNWALRPENQTLSNFQDNGGIAPEAADSEMEDEDGVTMEDVM